MSKLSSQEKSQAKQNAKRRGKKAGAFDNLRAAGKKMKRAKKKS